MKTKVRVELTAMKEVEIVVEHEPDEDPTDLTRADEELAKGLADFLQRADWVVNRVDEIGAVNE